MPYRRGSGSVEVELSKLQSWVEQSDPILFGTGGEDRGLVREHQDDRQERKVLEKEHAKAQSRTLLLCACFGAVPVVILLLQLAHIIPKL